MTRAIELAATKLAQLGDARRSGIKTLMTPIFNAAGFGAKGDGTTDDTASLQAMLDATGADHYTDNMVFIPAGHYKITAPLQIPSFTRVFGAGLSLTRITQATPGVPVLAPKTANRGPGQVSRTIWIEGMTLSGGSYGLDAENFYESTLRHVLSQDATIAAFRYYNNQSACYYHEISDCQVARCPVGLLTESTPGFAVTVIRMYRGTMYNITTGIKLLGGGTNYFDQVAINEATAEHVYCDSSDNRFQFMRIENFEYPTATPFRFTANAVANVITYPTVAAINLPWVIDGGIWNQWLFGQSDANVDPVHLRGPVSITGGYLALGGMRNSRGGWAAGAADVGGDFYWDANFFGANLGALRYFDGTGGRLVPRSVGNMADITAAPTQANFNALLAKLREAGILA